MSLNRFSCWALFIVVVLVLLFAAANFAIRHWLIALVMLVILSAFAIWRDRPRTAAGQS